MKSPTRQQAPISPATQHLPQQGGNSPLKQRIITLLQQVGAGMHEREQTLAVALLGAIAGLNTFLYGPPGTAKSLISRRLAAAFKAPHYFEYLMNRFSTPEEVFGPVSLKELKEDRYIRQVEDYLPTADFAFLDEIWKSSPAILNSLLTIINEHIYKNGKERLSVPLKALIAASNEVPAENQGLDALYDRFIIRLDVPPIQHDDNFNRLLNARPSTDKPAIAADLLINFEELAEWRHQVHDIHLSDDTLQVIKYIRVELANRFEQLGVYVSDRRWQRAAVLLKASAFINGRTETNLSDAILLKHCLWTKPENREEVTEIVMAAVKTYGIGADTDIAELDRKKESLDKEIHQELYHTDDVYETVKLASGGNYFKTDMEFEPRYRGHTVKITGYIPYERFKSLKDFHPLDRSGNQIQDISGKFDNQGVCILKYYDSKEDFTFKPNVLFHKGDKKPDINPKLIKVLVDDVAKIRNGLEGFRASANAKIESYRAQLQTPFATRDETDVAIQGMIEALEKITQRIDDCDRLDALCK
ncbi:MAG: AAA family ATPase [Atribacterota bacterium]|jgi:MoxR-like ATPase|nr:AAA family ATPase [Atribacterota bacterium]